MTIEKKLLGTSPSGGATNVAEVFSTFLYKGTGGALTVNNGIDLAGEGGLTWIKSRSNAYDNVLINSESGITKSLFSNDTGAEDTNAPYITSYNSNGFTLAGGGWYGTNETNFTYASWTFRKKEKFFTCLTYTGNGVAGREIPHGLAGPVGMLVVKCTSNAQSWPVWQKSIPTCVTYLNTTSGSACGTGNGVFGNAAYTNINPTDSVFTVGADNEVNGSGRTYVAYLFADNSSEDADDQMIKCGSFTTDGSGAASVNLGWEPQFLLTKKTNASADWVILDSMRGFPTKGIDNAKLSPNTNGAEAGSSSFGGGTAANGFSWFNDGASQQYIYMAIRAPMMVEPENATDVFGMSNAMTQPLPAFNSTFPVDMSLNKRPAYSQNVAIGSRLQGTKHLYTDTNTLEVNEVEYVWDFMDGWGGFNSSNSDYQSWNWKRAKGYMDCVAYIGTGSNTPHSHSLAAVPEMMWLKPRDANGQGGHNWLCWHKAMPINTYMMLNYDNAQAAFNWSNETLPTKTGFTVKSNVQSVNQATKLYMAYLFSTLAGISKCGSYTGNGSYQTISCGFSAGSRFVLIKRTDAAGDWYVWDSVRGIVAGNDPHLSLNTLSAQVTSDDSVDPHNSGFIVNQVSATNINVSSGTYIFYAIA